MQTTITFPLSFKWKAIDKRALYAMREKSLHDMHVCLNSFSNQIYRVGRIKNDM